MAEGGVAGDTRVIRFMTRVTTDDEGDFNIYLKSLNVRLELATVCHLIILCHNVHHNEMRYVSSSEAST